MSATPQIALGLDFNEAAMLANEMSWRATGLRQAIGEANAAFERHGFSSAPYAEELEARATLLEHFSGALRDKLKEAGYEDGTA